MIKRSILTYQNLHILHKRHNSAFIPNMVSYFKDKGTWVPGAKHVLSHDEYERYKLFRTIKLGKKNELDDILKKDKFTNVSKDTLISFTEELQKQPYSIPNFLLSWWGIQYGTSGIMLYANQINLFGTNGSFDKLVKIVTPDNIEHIEHASNMYVGISASLAALGAFSIYHSINIFYQEAKSPYYDYDGILKSLKKSSFQTGIVEPVSNKVNEVTKLIFDSTNKSTEPSDALPPSSLSSGSYSAEPLELSDHPDLNFPNQSVDEKSEVDPKPQSTLDK